MKILRVSLLAFGPFTGTVLAMADGNKGLHMVYGPNEAGKSSALRAIRQLLYGIPVRSPDNFIHSHAKMRIGGLLCRDDGTVLEFIRRKGRVNTIREPDDIAVIDDSRLRTFLGGVDEGLFSTLFAIGHTDLVRGGKEILQGKGHIGPVLFAAGAGISDLRRVQDNLNAQCDALFLPKGRNPRINAALAALRECRQAIRGVQLSGRKWTEHRAGLGKAVEEKQSVEIKLGKLQRERHRLERIREALPLIGRRKELLEDLKPFAHAVLLPDDFSDRRRSLITDLRLAEETQNQAIVNLKSIGRALAALAVPDVLIENAEAVETIHQELGSHRKAIKDRSQLQVRKEILEKDAQAILLGIREDLTLTQADQVRIGKTESVEIRELGNRYEGLVTRLETVKEEIDKLTLRIDHLKHRVQTDAGLPDIGNLRRIIERVRKLGSVEETCRTEHRQIRQSEKAIRIALKKQTLWSGTLEALESLSLPAPETIDEFERRLMDTESELSAGRSEQASLQKEVLSLDRQLEQLRLQQEVPTEEELAAIRGKRDNGWQLIRRRLEKKNTSIKGEKAFVADFPPAADLPGAYELSVRRADDLADRLRREADRVAKKSTLVAEKRMRTIQLERLDKRLESIESGLVEIRSEWDAIWHPLGISPRSPREMRSWAAQMAGLADRVFELRERRIQADNLKAQIRDGLAELSTGLVAAGQPPAEKGETLAHLLQRTEAFVHQVEKKRLETDQMRRELADREAERRLAESRRKAAQSELEKWQTRWEAAILPIGLKPGATPGQAAAVMEDLKALFDKIGEAEILGKRIAGIDRDAGEFNRKLDQLVRRLAPDLSDLPPEAAVVELNSRLIQAREAAARQQGLEKQKRYEEDRLKRAEVKNAEIHAQLEAMCEEAGCRSHGELPEAEKRSARRRDMETQLEQVDERLRRLSGGLTVEAFISETAAMDPDTIDPALERLTEEINALKDQRSRLDQRIGQEKNELSKMDGSARAAELAEEAQGLTASLAADVEQYVRLRLALEVLKKGIENYRESHQEPVLKRSAVLFSHLTCGSFEGLRVEVDGRGNPVLVGIRSGGKEIVGVEAMSDGTVDQLYLAVRLASLEMVLDHHESMPLIVDDILINFDDDRAAATLDVLARLSDRTQVIFFTHHRHLVELAEAHADSSRLFVHSLE